MNEISIVAQEIAASRQRGIPADEGKLWETLRLDAERAAAGEEMLRSFLDLLVLRHDGFASGLSLLLAHKLTEDSMPAERLGEIARAAMAGDPGIITAAIADLVAIRTRDPAAENYLSRQSRNQTGGRDKTLPRPCGQFWMIRRSTSAQFVPANAGAKAKNPVGSTLFSTPMVALLRHPGHKILRTCCRESARKRLRFFADRAAKKWPLRAV